jgi:hypothetical protein
MAAADGPQPGSEWCGFPSDFKPAFEWPESAGAPNPAENGPLALTFDCGMA